MISTVFSQEEELRQALTAYNAALADITSNLSGAADDEATLQVGHAELYGHHGEVQVTSQACNQSLHAGKG